MKNLFPLSLISLIAVMLISGCFESLLPQLNHDATLIGPDTDKNGIRDDIDAYIATLPYTKLQKKAIQQDARALTATLTVDKTDKAALMAVSFQIDRAVECLYDQLTPETNKASKLASDNEKMIVNTKNRFMEYEKYNSSLSGEVFSDSSLKGAVCDK